MVKHINAISFELIKSDPYCFKISANQSENIRLSYQVSGKGEKKTRIQFFSPQKEVLKDTSGKISSYITHAPKKPGIYQICFSRMDMNIKTVNLNIVKLNKNTCKSTCLQINKIVIILL